MPCVRPGMRKPPPGFERINEKLDEFEAAMRDAVQAPSLGVLPTALREREAKRRRTEAGPSKREEKEGGPTSAEPARDGSDAEAESEMPPLWRVAQINRDRTRYVFNAYYRQKLINKEVFDYCCEMQLIDSGLVKRWRLPGYEKLCCTACAIPGAASAAGSLTTKLALRDKAGRKRHADEAEGDRDQSTCLCRVPAGQRRATHFSACALNPTQCGMAGRGVGGYGGSPALTPHSLILERSVLHRKSGSFRSSTSPYADCVWCCRSGPTPGFCDNDRSLGKVCVSVRTSGKQLQRMNRQKNRCLFAVLLLLFSFSVIEPSSRVTAHHSIFTSPAFPQTLKASGATPHGTVHTPLVVPPHFRTDPILTKATICFNSQAYLEFEVFEFLLNYSQKYLESSTYKEKTRRKQFSYDSTIPSQLTLSLSLLLLPTHKSFISLFSFVVVALSLSLYIYISIYIRPRCLQVEVAAIFLLQRQRGESARCPTSITTDTLFFVFNYLFISLFFFELSATETINLQMDETPTQRSPPPKEIRLFQVLAAHSLDVHLPNFLLSVAASLEMPLVTLLGRRFGLTNNYIAQLVALVALSRAIIDIPCGVLIEFIGLRRVMISSVLLNIAAALVGLHSTSSLSLLLFCVLSGSSLGCFFLARHVFVARVVAKRYRGTFMSTISGVMRWAHVLGPTVGGVVIQYTGDVRDALYVSVAATTIATLSLLVSFWPSAVNDTIFSPVQAQQGSFTPGAEAVSGSTPTTCQGTLPVPLATVSYHSISHIHSQDQSSYGGLLHPPLTSPVTWSCPAPHCTRSFCLSGMLGTLRSHARTIFCLGVYVVLFTALRANRKLMIAFAGLHASLSDAHLTFLISFGFSVDAVLFPLGGIVIDRLGRQWAMVPVTVGLALTFLFLPFATTTWLLFAASGMFGLADSLGCGLIMTLVADRAPPKDSAPFFGIMRTLEDMGHVLGASGVGSALQQIGFAWTCWLLAVGGFGTAAWGVLLIPVDKDASDEEEQTELCSRRPSESILLLGTPSRSKRDGDGDVLVEVGAGAGGVQGNFPTPGVLHQARSPSVHEEQTEKRERRYGALRGLVASMWRGILIVEGMKAEGHVLNEWEKLVIIIIIIIIVLLLLSRCCYGVERYRMDEFSLFGFIAPLTRNIYNTIKKIKVKQQPTTTVSLVQLAMTIKLLQGTETSEL
eukprot:gene629-348_t